MKQATAVMQVRAYKAIVLYLCDWSFLKHLWEEQEKVKMQTVRTQLYLNY